MNPVGTAVPAWHSTYRPLMETGAAEDPRSALQPTQVQDHSPYSDPARQKMRLDWYASRLVVECVGAITDGRCGWPFAMTWPDLYTLAGT